MFEELNRYQNGKFNFSNFDKLSLVCDAPKNCGGIYLIYKECETIDNLIYIGRSGKINKDRTIRIRENGMYGRFVKGKQFGGWREQTWPIQMEKDNIRSLVIHWYVTLNEIIKDNPVSIEEECISKYKEKFTKLPLWNKKERG